MKGELAIFLLAMGLLFMPAAAGSPHSRDNRSSAGFQVFIAGCLFRDTELLQ